jgi:plastocyanin
MEEQLGKTKNLPKRRPRVRIILSGFTALFAAIVLVTVLTTQHVAKKQQQARTEQARIAEVRITKTGFEPATLSVKRGTKIIWTNTDADLHQIASNPYPKGTDLASLKSEILNNDQTYTYTASTTGTFGYHDQMQPTINGTIVVRKQ